MSALSSLPYEVLANILTPLDFDDIFSLGRTCKELDFLLYEESICKVTVQTKLKYSNEALSATKAGKGYARALRRCAKRRLALTTAHPFSLAIVGFCDAYLYCNGVLCYTIDDKLRVLDLHSSHHDEVVICLPSLLTQALISKQSQSQKVFRVLYYSDRIISCLYTCSGPHPLAWLIVLSLRPRLILLAEELESAEKIFVRHNKQVLYYGTHSETGTDGYKSWVLQGFDLKSRTAFSQKIYLPDMVGSEIGSTICFEFYKSHFYALSNQTSFEVEEIDWTSFYHCIRFPLASPCAELLEKTVPDNSMWRRQHHEGPIDDRWTNLRLDVDESTGVLRIVESRKEWYLGSSSSLRTYYITDIKFPAIVTNDDLNYAHTPLDIYLSSPSGDASNLGWASYSPEVESRSSTGISSAEHAPTALPSVPLIRLLRKDDHPHHIEAPPRRPQDTHPENDGSEQPAFTLANSSVRTYHTSCSTYMDLVDDPISTDWQGTQRLRIRTGGRRLRPPLLNEEGVLRKPNESLQLALKEIYKESDIQFWPAAQNPDHPDEELDAIYRLLNPPSHLGSVHGTADERSIVYKTGGNGQPCALVYISFDPAAKLKTWDAVSRKCVGEGPHSDSRVKGREDECISTPLVKSSTGREESDRKTSIDRKGKGKENAMPLTQIAGRRQAMGEGRDTTAPEGRQFRRSSSSNWAWKERAMFRDINLGMYFGL